MRACVDAAKRRDLHAGVVVVKLARHTRALRFEQATHRVTERSLAAMANVQRAGRVGRDELNQHARRMVMAPAAERSAGGEHLGDHRLLRRRRQRQIDEARPGDIDALDPTLNRRLALQGLDQRGSQLARIALVRLGELHRRGACEIAMGGLAR